MSFTTISHINQNDIGVELRARVGYPLHDADCVKFLVNYPPNSAKEIEAVIVDPNDGIIKYKSLEGDFQTPGNYHIQAKIIMKDGSVFHGSTHTFKVIGVFR